MPSIPAIDALARRLQAFGRVAVAVSGGIDSLTLSTLAAHTLGKGAEMFHSQTGSVPVEATRRTRELAARLGWNLRVIDAHEFAREDYLANPVNRCFHCKQSLYAEIARHTDAQVLSGANADDLGEYRPGLDAARDAGVRHPFVEAGIGKAAIRAIARELGLGELAEIPASPCLSSRVETGIRIEVPMLKRIDAVEMEIRKLTTARAVRCRMRAGGVVIEMDADALGRAPREAIARKVFEVFGVHPAFEPYRTGSAFLT
jgi:uncharacterized protein